LNEKNIEDDLVELPEDLADDVLKDKEDLKDVNED
jgi:hypothetical protein